jgi:lipoprotein-anchoring transpeptidase ErfK/SrfK
MNRISLIGPILVAAALLFGLHAAPAHAGRGEAPASYPAAGGLRVAKLVARTRPDASAPVARVFRQFRPDYRPQIVLAVGSRVGADGRVWLHIELPMRPNGRLGWVPAETVDVAPVPYRILVHRGSRRMELFRGSKLVYATTVAVGRPGMETPLGHFYVQARFHPDDPFLGSFAFETSAYSRLTDWPGGGVVGIHGTSLPGLLGQAVSHGCVRMSNTAALVLKRYVALGTPISIIA